MSNSRTTAGTGVTISGGHRGLIEGTFFAERFGAKIMSFDSFGEEHKARLRRYRTFWRFYKGLHWDWNRGGGGDSESEPLVTMNYCKRLVDVQVNFLMKKGWDITIPDDPETPEAEAETRKFVKVKLDKIWKRNRKRLLSFELAQSGSVTGDTFVRVYWKNSGRFGSHAAMEVIPSHLCFPEYGGGEEGIDRKQLIRLEIAWPRFEEVVKMTFLGRKKHKTLVMYREVWTPEFREFWREDEMISRTANWAAPNIPVVHIKNYPTVGESYGVSDLHTVVELQRSVNETQTDIQDVVQYHGSPVTVLSGAKISQLERGANRVWSIPETASVANLELAGDLAASHRFMDSQRDAIFELSGVPRAAFGGAEAGGASSGVALAMKFLPLLEQRDVKIETYGEGLEELNYLLLLATESKDAAFRKQFQALPEETRYQTEISFPPPLPRDVMLELDAARTRLELGLSTRKMELEKMGHGDMSADEILKRVDAERVELAQAEFNVGQMLPGGGPSPKPASGNPNPRRPNPDQQGEAVSRRAEVEDEQGV